ncbi:MAG: s-methyl-5-thioribose-1-phosphate isomerase, partial [Gemmatimonadetes bacterium]|nr:s-methyl-5-thioribose-1-phosphate isomerase [Gemmatimonadota bacterium]
GRVSREGPESSPDTAPWPDPPSDGPNGVRRACDAALAVWRGEAARCALIGRHGLAVLPEEGARVLLHCNAGALATGGLGTATAPLYLAHEAGRDVRAYAGETRPVLQGARLTAWELSRAGIPVTVVTDSMAGALMAEGAVDLVLVGADAVTLDGTVVNKIGTYGLAVLARHHGLPFYAAVPLTTVDAQLEGSAVPIEERPEDEVRAFGDRPTVPPEAAVWNPAFDRTPPHLVTAIITEAGVIRPPYGSRLRDLAQGPPGLVPDPWSGRSDP